MCAQQVQSGQLHCGMPACVQPLEPPWLPALRCRRYWFKEFGLDRWCRQVG